MATDVEANIIRTNDSRNDEKSRPPHTFISNTIVFPIAMDAIQLVITPAHTTLYNVVQSGDGYFAKNTETVPSLRADATQGKFDKVNIKDRRHPKFVKLEHHP